MTRRPGQAQNSELRVCMSKKIPVDQDQKNPAAARGPGPDPSKATPAQGPIYVFSSFTWNGSQLLPGQNWRLERPGIISRSYT